MRQLTITVDEKTYALAETRASERHITISSLIAELLQRLDEDTVSGTPPADTEESRSSRLPETYLRTLVDGLSGRDSLSREQLYRYIG